MKLRYKLVFGILAGAATAGLAQAQTATQDIIVTRQAGFDLQGGSLDAIVAALKAKAPDMKPYATAAGGIESWAKQIPLAFPKGSETGHNTKAKPEIWSDSAGFAKDADDLATAAGKLQASLKAGDDAALPDEVKAVGAACGACHRAYRVRSSG